MSFLRKIMLNLPEVKGPTQKKLPFKDKLKWTLTILIIYFVLGLFHLFGLGDAPLQRFEYLAIILGANFGSILSLGIGPIVTASIVLQLLNGSGILKLDLTNSEGKKTFQGLQKLLAIFFIVFEAIIYVSMGGLSPRAGISPWVLIFQLFLGGILILFMDEVVQKWGFGSGLSLFIAAGVSQTIFVRAISPMHVVVEGVKQEAFVGAIPEIFRTIATSPITAALAITSIIATILVFVMCVYVQAMKVEIPLSFGRVRGHGIRWPLHFLYTSNIPVILVAALLANVQLLGTFMQNKGIHFLGQFDASGNPMFPGFVFWLQAPNPTVIERILTSNLQWFHILQSLSFMIFMILGAMLFSWFWVQTSGQDARSVANQITSSGLSIPGFRQDIRMIERMLQRYIGPLTIMGAIAVGVLAAVADVMGALSRGTGILLAVMIIYKLYEEVAKQHMMDMNPMMRKFMRT